MKEYTDRKMICKLYEFYKNEYMKPSENCQVLLSEFNKLRDKANEVMTVEKTEYVNKLFETYNVLVSEQNKQYFIDGFSLGVKLIIEGLNF